MNPPIDYARLPPRRSWILRWRWIWVSVFILIAAWAFVYTRSGRGVQTDACSQCGARRTTFGWNLFGWYVAYSTQIDLGAAGRSLEKYESKPCSHVWEFADFSSRAYGASGRGLHALSAHNFLDFPAMENILDTHLKSDPDFARKLRQYIKNGDGFTPWVEMLYSEASALQQATSMPVP